MTFILLEEALFWIMDLYFGQKQPFTVKIYLNDGVVAYKQAAFHITRSCVDYLWIIVMFSSVVRTLILTAPIHCRGSIGEQVM